MSALGWWLLAGGVWCVVSVPAAFVLGRVIGRRDAQKPAAPAPPPQPELVDVESDMDVFLSMIREPSEPSPSEPYRYRGEQ